MNSVMIIEDETMLMEAIVKKFKTKKTITRIRNSISRIKWKLHITKKTKGWFN